MAIFLLSVFYLFISMVVFVAVSAALFFFKEGSYKTLINSLGFTSFSALVALVWPATLVLCVPVAIISVGLCKAKNSKSTTPSEEK